MKAPSLSIETDQQLCGPEVMFLEAGSERVKVFDRPESQDKRLSRKDSELKEEELPLPLGLWSLMKHSGYQVLALHYSKYRVQMVRLDLTDDARSRRSRRGPTAAHHPK